MLCRPRSQSTATMAPREYGSHAARSRPPGPMRCLSHLTTSRYNDLIMHGARSDMAGALMSL